METILPAKVINKRTGKIAVVTRESDTNYHVRLESGKYSRWVKANTDIYHGCLAPIEKQRDDEKESAALIVETMVEPLIEAVSTSFQKVLDQLDYANGHLQNIALDIEKISQAIPLPGDLDDMPEPEPGDLIDGLVYSKGMTVLCGELAGRARLALQIAESIATGGAFLDRWVIPGKCLYVTDNLESVREYFYLTDLAALPLFNLEVVQSGDYEDLDRYDFIIVNKKDEPLGKWRMFSRNSDKPVLFVHPVMTRFNEPIHQTSGVYTIILHIFLDINKINYYNI